MQTKIKYARQNKNKNKNKKQDKKQNNLLERRWR